jgi:superfamily II DNA/RNA helicase
MQSRNSLFHIYMYIIRRYIRFISQIASTKPAQPSPMIDQRRANFRQLTCPSAAELSAPGISVPSSDPAALIGSPSARRILTAADVSVRRDRAMPTLALAAPGIREELVRALADAGVKELTPIQSECLPHCLAGSDVLAKAKTGTGKTFAFLLPTFELLARSNSRRPLPSGVDPVRALVLSSARELGTQIVTQAEKLAASLPQYNVETIMGASSVTPQRERLDPSIAERFSAQYGGVVDVMVATPGRLIEHLHSTSGFAARLAGVEVLILDECDMLLDGGFQRDIEEIISALPAGRQTLCFSATVPEKMLAVLGLALRPDHVVVDCVGEVTADSQIVQRVLVHPLERSLVALYALIREEMASHPDTYKVMAFLPTARQVQFSTLCLVEMGIAVLEIHSRRTATERSYASDTFRKHTKQVLLSSDVSARGVDYPDVTLVLQVGSPATRDVYVQRIGRTGRAGASGAAILLLCEYEKSFLSTLKGLPIEHMASDNLGSVEEMRAVRAAAARVDDEVATQTYRAWIVAMNGQRKALKWSKPDIVTNANLYAREVLGRTTIPTLPRKAAVECALVGLAGLNIEETPSDADAAAEAKAEAAPQLELVVKFDFAALGLAFKKDAMAAKAAIVALTEPESIALQASLDSIGEAMVGGYRITPLMVTLRMVEKRLSKNESSSSVSSLAKSRNASSASLATTCTDPDSLGSAAPSRVGSAVDLSDVSAEPPAQSTTKKKASPEEVKAATARVAAAGAALKEAMAAAAAAGLDAASDGAVIAAQAAMNEAKEAKSILMMGGSRKM